MTSEEKSPVACTEVRALLPAFLADEIPADQSLRIQEHLDLCLPCQRFRAFETAFDVSLKRALRPVAVPPSLILGVHERLAREEAGMLGRLGGLLASSRMRWAAAAALILALFVPAALLIWWGASRAVLPPIAEGAERVERGILVCSGCEMRAVPPDRQRGCRAFGHHPVLKAEGTGLWRFIETDASRALLTDADRYGDEIEVRGLFMDGLKYVKVTSYRYLTPARGGDQGL